uniref:AAA family ATPase n=1 Tax=Eubacterium cellulosolvens TaxID=29322 RepID=UPI001FA77E30|nr:AAA family ATPase [[Eubacterium] cellulosolvens]
MECYISNFGCLHENRIRFVRGLNTVLKENGWGKSTFAHFLLAMFYGFDNDKKKNPAERPRTRFAPWQGGIYGGTLTFEYEGKLWRIERCFGAESPREDKLLVYEAGSNLQTDRFGDVPGEEIFSVDAESFRRTVFLAQHDCRTYVTAGISAKIGDVSSENADMGGYTDAQDRIRKEMLSLTPDRKTGKLAKLRDEIAAVEAELSRKTAEEERAENLRAELEQTRGRIRDCRAEIEELQGHIHEAGLLKDRQTELEKFRSLKMEMQRAGEEVERLRAFFPGEIPPADVAENWASRASTLDRNAMASAGYTLRPEEEKEYERLRGIFHSVTPSDETLEEYRNKAEQIRDLSERIGEMELSASERKAYEMERELFLWNAPEERQMDQLIREWEERCTIRRGMSDRKKNLRALKTMIKMSEEAGIPDEPPAEEPAEEEEKKPRVGMKRIKAGGVLLTAALIYLLIDHDGLPGIGLVVSGFLLLAWGLSAMVAEGREKKAEKKEEKKPEENANTTAREQYKAILKGMRADDAYAAEIEQKISDFIGSLNLEVEEGEVAGLLHRIRGDASEYRRLGKRVQSLRNTHYVEQKEELEREMRDFLGRYYPEAAEGQMVAEAGMQKLRYDTEKFRTYSNMLLRAKSAENAGDGDAAALLEELRSFSFVPRADLRMQIAEISEKRSALERAEAEYGRRKAERDACEQSLKLGNLRGKIDASSKFPTKSLEELTAAYRFAQSRSEELTEQLKELKNTLAASEEKLSRLAEAQAGLERLQEEQQEALHRYEVLRRTSGYLRRAKVKFSGKYMAPMQESLEKYEEMLTGSVSGDFRMDADLNVTVRRAGLQRETELLSEGWQDLIGLCRRMSMIEAMYTDEKPFIVLDDPFVNLDDAKLEKALAFLRGASSEYQILYFACHESRAVYSSQRKRA